MKKFITGFFIALGVIFLLLIIVIMYFRIADPLGLQDISPSNSTSSDYSDTIEQTPGTNSGPDLSPAQEKALETFGIDPATLPTSISPEQEACFIEKLGQGRVNEIIAGDAPSAIELFKAKDCI